ncbi:MAG: hypothetical protein M3096_01995 [Actinomycetia bacterium]|nr:hypothetical protein [Actinomycetes bacterium]
MNELGENEGGLGAADYSFLFGNTGDKPVVGDWDGDGIDEIGLHRETSGFFYYRNTLTTGIADGQFYFGDPGDRFVAGDWGIVDGADTPAMFRPSNDTFYFRHTLTQGNADFQFTWNGESPRVSMKLGAIHVFRAAGYVLNRGDGGYRVPAIDIAALQEITSQITGEREAGIDDRHARQLLQEHY